MERREEEFLTDDEKKGIQQTTEENVRVVDSNGNELLNGDAATLTQSLKVKWMKDFKVGTTVKSIRLRPGETDAVDGRVDGVGTMVIKTCYLKKKK